MNRYIVGGLHRCAVIKDTQRRLGRLNHQRDKYPLVQPEPPGRCRRRNKYCSNDIREYRPNAFCLTPRPLAPLTPRLKIMPRKTTPAAPLNLSRPPGCSGRRAVVSQVQRRDLDVGTGKRQNPFRSNNTAALVDSKLAKSGGARARQRRCRCLRKAHYGSHPKPPRLNATLGLGGLPRSDSK